MAIIGKRLKEAREKAKFTQMKAAKKLGVSNGTLSGYERNYRDPDTDIINKMADLFGVSVEWLMGRTDDPTPIPLLKQDYKINNLHTVTSLIWPKDLKRMREFYKLTEEEVARRSGIQLKKYLEYEKNGIFDKEDSRKLNELYKNLRIEKNTPETKSDIAEKILVIKQDPFIRDIMDMNKRQGELESKKIYESLSEKEEEEFKLLQEYLNDESYDFDISIIQEWKKLKEHNENIEKQVSMQDLAAHRSDDHMEDLPEEAKREVENFKVFIRSRYGKQK